MRFLCKNSNVKLYDMNKMLQIAWYNWSKKSIVLKWWIGLIKLAIQMVFNAVLYSLSMVMLCLSNHYPSLLHLHRYTHPNIFLICFQNPYLKCKGVCLCVPVVITWTYVNHLICLLLIQSSYISSSHPNLVKKSKRKNLGL